MPSRKPAAPASAAGAPAGARERILDAAYELFSRRGVGAVGVDTVVARSAAAKMSLYRHFRSKEELVLAVLGRREREWTFGWLEAGINARAEEPAARLLAIFDVFDDWFQEDGFEGCSFINVLLESPQGSAARLAAAAHLAEIRKILARLAAEAGLDEPERFARTWHFLMKGCIVTAQEGHREAAREARQAGEIILRNWPARCGGPRLRRSP
ncbi:MAG TPA: helix-turn-helix domain-containing protein [Geminicoccaceae bacterium]|nr:helix-turn-helix domain-containing protein [Geminicoccaceae bacterium]